MTYQPADVASQFTLLGKKWSGYPTMIAELNAIIAGLNADPTTHDLTIATPPAAVAPAALKTAFANEALLIANRAKGGNILPAAIGSILNGLLSSIAPPVNTAPPTISFFSGTGVAGATTLLNNTVGVWQPAGPAISRQWLRNGALIAGATATQYVTVIGDAGASILCAVTATNAAGAATSNSNALSITA
jgi:hypothetical protein